MMSTGSVWVNGTHFGTGTIVIAFNTGSCGTGDMIQDLTYDLMFSYSNIDFYEMPPQRLLPVEVPNIREPWRWRAAQVPKQRLHAGRAQFLARDRRAKIFDRTYRRT